MRTLKNAQDRQTICDRLAALQPDDQRQWGVMTAAEMLCHVRGAFLLAMGEIEATPMTTPIPRAVLKAAALWAPMQWKANFATVPALRKGEPAMRIGGFEQDRAETLAAMERFCKTSQRRVDHAFFGPMSYTDWMRWGFLHTDHHLRQFSR